MPEGSLKAESAGHAPPADGTDRLTQAKQAGGGQPPVDAQVRERLAQLGPVGFPGDPAQEHGTDAQAYEPTHG